MEQEVVDRITDNLQGNSKNYFTVNPDWYVVCSITDRSDIASESVRVNGTVTIKTTAGHVLSTVSAQTNKQDFSVSGPAPINKSLQTSAVNEVINGLVQRATGPIQDAVETEIQTREKIISAQNLARRRQI